MEVYKDVKDMSLEEKQEYYKNGLKEAVKIFKGKLKAKPVLACRGSPASFLEERFSPRRVA